jgi:23S rRNA (adenine2503-C2)-methyltransferase
MKANLKSYSLTMLKHIMMDLGFESYRGEQIFKWLWQKRTKDFSAMTDISKEFRKLLDDKFKISGLITEKIQSAKDNSKKYLLKLEDDNYVEAVFVPEASRKTLCVSSQIGCPLACKFCATALVDFKRNLNAYEIAEEIALIQESCQQKITNIVFMGMGEPLLNVKEVLEAIKIISSPIGLAISQRHTTLSTVGLIKEMKILLKMPLKVKLAISLNFSDEEMRNEFMPVTKQNPLKPLLEIAKEYSLKKNMVTFEYVIIDRLNDRIRDARRLLKLLKGIPSKINVIPFNPHPLLPYKRPAERKIERFCQYLLNSHHTITLRKSRGQEILAGCGQLVASHNLSEVN